MFEQKAIAIPRDWGLRVFADAVEATLEELATGRWESRIFQLGPAGVVILASRPQSFDADDPFFFDGAGWDDMKDDEIDGLEPRTREMLDKIFEFVGPVSLDIALEAMPSAVHGVTRVYPHRFLEEAFEELQQHHEQHISEHDEGETCEYAQVVAAVLLAMREGLRSRLN